jgi:SAM-dependent methyltransferase
VTDPTAREKSAALVERLNVWWRIEGPPPTDHSLRYRLAYPIRRLVARLLGPQETFNSTLVQYINSAVRPIEDYLHDFRSELNAERAARAAALDEIRRHREVLSARERQIDMATAALDAAGRHGEALAARERRMQAAMAALGAGQDELRTSVAAAHQAILDLSRRFRAAAPASVGAAPTAPNTESGVDPITHRYVGFEDLFRGSPETIRAAVEDYVPIFEGRTDVLDIGCGRGEFLSLLAGRGVSARGIDVNAAMADLCREKGLDAIGGDALSYLRSLGDGSLGGLFSAQVVEHLEPGYLTNLLAAAFEKLRPGAPIVLETINPSCWFAFFESYIRDLTHVRPLHPDTLRFLLVASGFQQVEIRFRAPYPEHEKLQRVALPRDLPGTLGRDLHDAADTFNANVEKINALLFTHLDYAAIGRRA